MKRIIFLLFLGCILNFSFSYANSAPYAYIQEWSSDTINVGDLLTIVAAADDIDGDSCRIKIDWGDGQISNFSPWIESDHGKNFTHTYQSGGTYQIRAQAEDYMENLGDWSQGISITVIGEEPPPEENFPPSATVESVTPNPASVNSTVNATIIGRDPEGKFVKVKVDWGDGEITSYHHKWIKSGERYNLTHTYSSVGVYNIKAMAKDYTNLEGEWSADFPLEVGEETINENMPPFAFFEMISKEQLTVNEVLNVSVIGIDPENSSVQLKIDWGDGSSTDFSQAMPSEQLWEKSYSYSDPGSYGIKVQAKDQEGNLGEWSEEIQIEVIENTNEENSAPNAYIENISGDTIQVNDIIELDCIGSDPEGGAVKVKIDWGDGEMSDFSDWLPSGELFHDSHQYTSSGIYQVKVVAQDEPGLTGDWSEGSKIVVIDETVQENSAPVAFFENFPDVVNAEEDFLVEVIGEDMEQQQVRLKIDWGDGEITPYSEWEPSGNLVQFFHSFPTEGEYKLKVMAKDQEELESTWTDSVLVKVITHTPVDEKKIFDFKKLQLFQNYPNPFNSSTLIKFVLPENKKVRLEIYSLLGNKISTLLDKNLHAGLHQVNFHANNLSTGSYFILLRTDNNYQVKKMLYLK